MIRCIYKMIAIDKSNYSCDKHRVMWYYHASKDGASSYISNISSSLIRNGDETNTKSKLAEKSNCEEADECNARGCGDREREDVQSAFFSFGFCHLCLFILPLFYGAYDHIYLWSEWAHAQADKCACICRCVCVCVRALKVHKQRSANAIWECEMPTRNAKTINHLIMVNGSSIFPS